MENFEFSPRESMERAFARWWIIVLITVLGGITGWVFHFFQPPMYEATATITVTMEFEKRSLTQFEEDYAFNAAGDIIKSTQVKNQSIAEAHTSGFQIDLNSLQPKMFAEGKQSVWELRIRDRNPKTAAGLVNIWAGKATEALEAALRHALRAGQIQDQISSIMRGQYTASVPSETTLQGLTDELVQEKRLSQGIISIMTFALTDTATVPVKPILYNLANLVLAGACIGFVISLWVVNSYRVQHRD